MTDEAVELYLESRRKVRADVLLTSFTDWADLAEAIRKLWRDRAAVTPAVSAKALEITRDATTDEGRLRALDTYVATGIRYVSVQMGVGTLRPRRAEEVLTAGFGDCKDKHTLLVSMLAAVGIRADAVLIDPILEAFDESVPTPAQFSHVITAVDLKPGATTWLDTTLEVAPFGYLTANERDSPALRIPASGPAVLVRTPGDPAPTQVWRTETTGTLGADGRLEATVREVIGGDAEIPVRALFRRAPQSQLVNIVSQMDLPQFYRGKVSDITFTAPEDTARPFQVEYRLVVDSFSNWKEGSIYPPVAFDLPAAPPDKVVVPLQVGPVGERIATARIQVAPAFQLTLPTSTPAEMRIDQEFGTFAGHVSVKGQLVEIERRLTRKMAEVPVDKAEAYRGFAKAVDAVSYRVDLRAFRPWAWNDTATIDWYARATPSISKTLAEAAAAGRRGDYQEAIATARQVTDAEPDSDAAWQMLGWAQFESGDRERGLETLRSRVGLTSIASLSKYYAGRLAVMGRNDEAVAVWNEARKRFPDDSEIPLYLGFAQAQAGRFTDALVTLTPERDRQNESARFHTTLGRAYLGAKQTEAGVAAYRRSAEIDASVNNLNNVAWELAERNAGLDIARTLAERAIAGKTTEVNRVTLANLSDASVRLPTQLAAYWDTLGRVHFRLGAFDVAEQWLRAAWRVSHAFDMASHLEEVYRGTKDTGNQKRYAAFMAIASNPLTGMARLTQIVPDAAERIALTVEARTARETERTTVVAGPVGARGTARVFLAIRKGGIVDDVAFIDGDATLRTLPTSLRSATLPWHAPDDALERVVRRATVVCPPDTSGQCSLLLDPVGNVTSVK